ncbi:MAG: GNAT family N-acetyltransferase [Gammaproteobacteria bacterium]|nr:GNAT family N-acetyltransferase [Gammaproteobacteria bacterium]
MTIYFGKADEFIYDHHTLYNMFRFRHHIFHDRLKWDVNSIGGMEYDEFDTLNPYHMIAVNHDQQVEACWRLLPTTGPYMLQKTFSQLLKGENAPSQNDVWELSRFAVISSNQKKSTQAVMSELSFQMFQQTYEFAIQNNIKSYVTVVSAAVERMFMRAGFPMRRFGDGESQKIGKITTVACWMDVNEQYKDAAYQLSNSRNAA